MKRYKKIAAWALTAAIAAGLSACGQSASGTEEPAGAGTDNSASGENSGGYQDYSNGFDETVTIQIPVYDRAFEGWNVTDNYYTQWIQSEFGDKYNINVEFVAITRTTEVNDFMQMLASGKAIVGQLSRQIFMPFIMNLVNVCSSHEHTIPFIA